MTAYKSIHCDSCKDHGGTTDCHQGSMSDAQSILVRSGELDYRFGKWRILKARCIYDDTEDALFNEGEYVLQLMDERLASSDPAVWGAIEKEIEKAKATVELWREHQALSK